MGTSDRFYARRAQGGGLSVLPSGNATGSHVPTQPFSASRTTRELKPQDQATHVEAHALGWAGWAHPIRWRCPKQARSALQGRRAGGEPVGCPTPPDHERTANRRQRQAASA